MTKAGMIFMAISWLSILSLATFCIRKGFFEEKESIKKNRK